MGSYLLILMNYLLKPETPLYRNLFYNEHGLWSQIYFFPYK